MKKPVALVALIACLLLVVWLSPISEWLTAGIEWIDANRTVSWAVFIVLYICATVLLLPGSILTLGAGFLFGLTVGFAMVSFASVVGASLAFLIGRFFAREWVRGKLSGLPRFAALDRAIEHRGALIVFLTRLSPVFPFNLLNYALGLTGVRFSSYALASWIGMMPGTLLYVYLGSVASDVTNLLNDGLDNSPVGNWPLYVGLIATLVLTVVITRIATRSLHAELEEPQPSGETG